MFPTNEEFINITRVCNQAAKFFLRHSRSGPLATAHPLTPQGLEPASLAREQQEQSRLNLRLDRAAQMRYSSRPNERGPRRCLAPTQSCVPVGCLTVFS
jgi:hypothetical protein